ncbi:MAG TPA: ACT domain-containing protein, partial [Pseudonocardia sp.]|nr:ACT domain-containing protein [Pseudonocardia sp.]
MVLWRVHVELEDRPGRLGELATAVGRAGCNIISLHVVGEPADDGAVTDELLVRVPSASDPAALVDEIGRAGIPCTLLVRADAVELADPATTALALARMVVAEPGSAPSAVATMLRARLVDPAAESAP